MGMFPAGPGMSKAGIGMFSQAIPGMFSQVGPGMFRAGPGTLESGQGMLEAGIGTFSQAGPGVSEAGPGMVHAGPDMLQVEADMLEVGPNMLSPDTSALSEVPWATPSEKPPAWPEAAEGRASEDFAAGVTISGKAPPQMLVVFREVSRETTSCSVGADCAKPDEHDWSGPSADVGVVECTLTSGCGAAA